MSKQRIRCIVCCYELTPAEVNARLCMIGMRIDAEFFGHIVDNRRVAGATPAGWEVHSGSNKLMDFSAYVEGAQALSGTLAEGEAVLFLNDTLFTRHHAGFHLGQLLGYAAYVGSVPAPSIAGKTDNYSNIVYGNPWSGLNTYVSSFAFLMNQGAIDILLAAYSGMWQVMGAEPLADESAWGQGLELDFREFLRAHLFLPGTPSAWYQAGRYAKNLAMLRNKARCVYLEHKVSGEIGKHGVIVALYPRARDKARFTLHDRLARVQRLLTRALVILRLGRPPSP